ncbi:hypothetical protein TeGR_g5733 [Tetraparma gracilis]|uniref:Uncharacterized protein n=1 Tax=Tetraparma gracilis TaxID=2962635 RepID=A0ABQ6N2J4_9STRA|nr:hypothetical protein TeGR_g5733 [Tetraparma gracilis]
MSLTPLPPSGLSSETILVEFNLLLSSPTQTTMTFKSLDARAMRTVAGSEYSMRALSAMREAAQGGRVAVSGSIYLEPKKFGCTEFTLTAAVEHRATTNKSSSMGGVTGPRSSGTSTAAPAVVGGDASTTSSPDTDANVGLEGTSREAAGAVLSFLVGAAPRLHDEFARYEEVDSAMLQYFAEHGMDDAPESSEKEKGEES